MAWIESHQSLAGHPKTRRAARMLGVSVPAMIGHLHCFWYWALDYSPNGVLDGITSEEIADAAMWDGDPDELLQALIGCGFGGRPGFIEQTKKGYLIHDWHDYAGKLVDKRKADAERKKAGRRADDEGISEECPTDVQRTSSGHPTDGARTAQVPYRTVPYRTVPTVPKKQEKTRARAKEEPKDPEPVDNELLDELLFLASKVRSSVAEWKPTGADRTTFAALVKRFPPEQLREELDKFAAYTPQRDYKAFGRAFASWMGRVKPLPMTVARPAAHKQRIDNAVAQLKATGDEDLAQALCLPEEWPEVLKRSGHEEAREPPDPFADVDFGETEPAAAGRAR